MTPLVIVRYGADKKSSSLNAFSFTCSITSRAVLKTYHDGRAAPLHSAWLVHLVSSTPSRSVQTWRLRSGANLEPLSSASHGSEGMGLVSDRSSRQPGKILQALLLGPRDVESGNPI